MRELGHLLGTAPALLWTSTIADALIGAAYYSIALALAYLAVRRGDLAFRSMFFVGSASMLAGGTVYLAPLIAAWPRADEIEATVKAAAAAVSAIAAILLWPIVPKVIGRRLPSTDLPSERAAELRHADEGEDAAEERFLRLADELEASIAEHAAEVRTSRQLLQREIEARARAESNLSRAKATLDEAVAAQGRHAMALAQLGALGGLLQSCRTEGEIYSTVARFAAGLFDAPSGAIYVLDAAQNAAAPGKVWGTIPADEQTFAARDCRALREGKAFPDDATAAVERRCPHLRTDPAQRHACVPLLVAGELLGVLHLRERAVPIEGIERTLIALAAERIALAIAAIKRRDSVAQQLVRDPLTGLYSRRYLEEFLAVEERRGLRSGHSIGIAMIDLDHFGRVNDAHGRPAGDVVLRRIAALLQEQTRAGDLPGRYGGEEFLLVLPGASLEVTLQRAEQLRASIASERLAFRGDSIEAITASIGVSAFPESGTSVAAAVAAAGRALNLAKRNGGNCVECDETRAAA